jgi:hypothetical protein
MWNWTRRFKYHHSPIVGHQMSSGEKTVQPDLAGTEPGTLALNTVLWLYRHSSDFQNFISCFLNIFSFVWCSIYLATNTLSPSNQWTVQYCEWFHVTNLSNVLLLNYKTKIILNFTMLTFTMIINLQDIKYHNG